MEAQLPDKIMFQGAWMDLYSNPLEDYWLHRRKRHPYFIAYPKLQTRIYCILEIHDNQLFLVDIEGKMEKQFLFFKRVVPCTLKSLFPKSSRRVKADWFTGKIRIPTGKMTMFEDRGYDSRFEKEQIITVNHGEIVKSVSLDFMQKRLVVTSDDHSLN